MKFALVVLVILPFTMGNPVDENSASFGGYDYVDLVKQMLSQLGQDGTIAQCEAECPAFLENMQLSVFAGIVLCVPLCKELKKMAQDGQ